MSAARRPARTCSLLPGGARACRTLRPGHSVRCQSESFSEGVTGGSAQRLGNATRHIECSVGNFFTVVRQSEALRLIRWTLPVVISVALLSGCGGPTSYGKGSFGFSVIFLANPWHDGPGPMPNSAPVGSHRVVAGASYRSFFQSSQGSGSETVQIREWTKPFAGCLAQYVKPFVSPCPSHGDIAFRSIYRQLTGVNGGRCSGYSGRLAIVTGKFTFYLFVICDSQSTVNAVLDSFRPND